MERFASPVTVLFFLVFCVPTIVFPAQLPKAMRIAYPQFPPFHWQDQQGKLHGMFYEILSEAFEKRMHQPLQWTHYPWARCQEQLKAGRDDAILTVPTKARLRYTKTHPHPFFNKPLHLFTYRDHPLLKKIRQIQTLPEIQALHLSVITYAKNGWNQDHVAALGIKTLESAYLDSVWIMLARHRGDLVIEWPRAAKIDLQRLDLETKVIDSGVEVAQMPFHLLIQKNSPFVRLLGDFEKTLQTMKADGTLITILQRYDSPVGHKKH
jgi:polar amino acid transport system substrate-binding protein